MGMQSRRPALSCPIGPGHKRPGRRERGGTTLSTHHHSPTIPLSLGLTAVLLGTAGYTAHSTLTQSTVPTQPAAHTATARPLDVTVTASEFKLSPSPLVVPV